MSFLLTSEVAEYVAWLNSLQDVTEPLAAAQDDAEDYAVKLKDMRTVVEDTMETLFTYDGLYNGINRTFVDTKEQCVRIGTLRDETNKSIAEGEDLIDQARGFLVDAENNIQVPMLLVPFTFRNSTRPESISLTLSLPELIWETARAAYPVFFKNNILRIIYNTDYVNKYLIKYVEKIHMCIKKKMMNCAIISYVNVKQT